MPEPAPPHDAQERPGGRLGAALRRAREDAGLTQRALAKRLNRGRTTLAEYELGYRLPPLDAVRDYERETGCPAGSLVSELDAVLRSPSLDGAVPPGPPDRPVPNLDGGQPAVEEMPVSGPRPRSPKRRLVLRALAVAVIVGVVVVGGVVGLSRSRSSDHLDLTGVDDRVAIGDYNGDGKADIALGYDRGGGRMQIFGWTSSGSTLIESSKSRSFEVGGVAGRMASGNVDGDRDGKDDIVVAAQVGSALSLKVWKGGSTYAGDWYTGEQYDLAPVGDRFAVGDFTGDGKADVALGVDTGDGAMRIDLWSSTGSAFVKLDSYRTDAVRPTEVAGRMASGDVDGDGKDDLVMAAYSPDGTFAYHVWSGGTSYRGTWYTSGQFNLNLVGDRLTLGDYSGDRKADAAVAYDNRGDIRLWWWSSTGSAFDNNPTRYDAPALSGSAIDDRMASGDMDGDGRDDIVVVQLNADGTFDFRVWGSGAADDRVWYTSRR